MTCSYCGTRNCEGEHRCSRCGRRPTDILNVGALATKPWPAQKPAEPAEPSRSPLPMTRPANLSRAVQKPLFQDRSDSNVIPFESYVAAPARAPIKQKT